MTSTLLDLWILWFMLTFGVAPTPEQIPSELLDPRPPAIRITDLVPGTSYAPTAPAPFVAPPPAPAPATPSGPYIPPPPPVSPEPPPVVTPPPGS